MKTNDIITENGYTVEQGISGYYRLVKDGEVIYDDSACEDLNEDKETAEAFFNEYLTKKLAELDKMKRFRVFVNNNVECAQVADFDTLDEAKTYCSEECKGCEPVCDGDTEFEHRATTKRYEVYDGDPCLYEDGEVVSFKTPVYETDPYYYI